MKKKAILVLALAMMFSVSGCGKTEKLMTLTDEERAQIVQFSAHIISEFNRSQPEGYRPLSKVQIDAINAEEEKKKNPQKTEEQSSDNPQTSGQSGEAEKPARQEGTLTDLVGVSGIEATCKGYKVQKDYVEENVFAMNASEGNKYVVVKVRLTNTTNAKVNVDILSKNPSVSLQINGEESTSHALLTLLTNDLLTTKKKLDAGESLDTVLLFEVEKSKADSIQNLALIAKDGDTEKIILIN
ncbi:MAG: DUF4352 domain-containing protein [Lachnospiraceae bacterium]|nr:DUF4352 domain-containing protein [Lachnospiraceae bacterium]